MSAPIGIAGTKQRLVRNSSMRWSTTDQAISIPFSIIFRMFQRIKEIAFGIDWISFPVCRMINNRARRILPCPVN